MPSTEAVKGFPVCVMQTESVLFKKYINLFCNVTNMVLVLLGRSECIFVSLFLCLPWIQKGYFIRLMCKTCTECGAVNLHCVWTKAGVADCLACLTAD